MSPEQLPQHACPEHLRLLAFAEGTLDGEDTLVLESHVAACERCDARLSLLEEQSDTLVRALAELPASADDEATFQEVHAALLARPERFSTGTATTEAFGMQPPLPLTLPLQLGNYELLEQIGAGAQGAVFRARHRRLEREVAIKLLLHAAESAVADFLNEMRIVGQLDHPNIVRATDAGEHDGVYFLVMEFVPGLDVSSLLRKVGQLSVSDASEIARQTAVGLEMAHEYGLVHRDIKTSNLLFTVHGEVKILDLGLATITTLNVEARDLKGPRGTADYMAPEQWLEASRVTAAADIYSLGCTLYKLLTGTPPFHQLPADCATKQQAHREAPVPSLLSVREDIPVALDQFVQRMLAKNPWDRPASAREVAETLARFARGNALPALASCLFPEAARQVVLPPSRPISRRLVIASGLVSATALAMLAWPKPRRVPLQRNRWRRLGPATPPLVTLGPNGAGLEHESDETLLLRSDGPVLLQFGHPVGARFKFRTTLQRGDWNSPAGVFFSLRRQANDRVELHFYTLELQSTTPFETALRWVAYHALDHQLDSPTLLAEAVIDSPTSERVIEITLGRNGFPDVRLNGQLHPKTAWTCANEARDLITTSTDQLPVTYAGRIGVFQYGGETRTKSTELMYLDE